MKTVFLNGSPKKKFSASGYLLSLQRLFVRGQKVTCALRGRGGYQPVLEELRDADAVVFCLPLYVDGLPSHVLLFLKEMEQFCVENGIKLHVYVISNNGFIEGRQNKPLMQVFENFCARSGLNWCGGIGVGGGVMLNVTRILILVFAGILALNLLAGGGVCSSLKVFAIQMLVLLFLNGGVLFYEARMGACIWRAKAFGKKYTRILLPSFVFILFADLFFLMTSVFQGGFFRGWLAKKEIQKG